MTQPIDPFNKYEAGAKVADGSVYAVSEDRASQECAEFQALMPKRIGAGEDLQTYPHMSTCERCTALVRDLEYIAEVARQLIPIEEEPRDELWAQIQLAIERGEA